MPEEARGAGREVAPSARAGFGSTERQGPEVRQNARTDVLTSPAEDHFAKGNDMTRRSKRLLALLAAIALAGLPCFAAAPAGDGPAAPRPKRADTLERLALWYLESRGLR